MADPQLPRGIRAQVILPGKSGIPEDRFITTWAFQAPSGGTTEAHESQVAADLIEFFNITPATGIQAVGVYMSDVVERSLCEVRTYQMGQAPPREMTSTPFSLTGTGTQGYPEEVAITLSFYSVRNLPRQRGRVYLGPLKQTSGGTNTTGRVFPITGLRDDIKKAAQRLMAKDPLTRPQWCVLSRVNGLLHPVTAGWVDDAFDIQRRRGIKATARTTF